MIKAADILSFWYDEAMRDAWFRSTPDIDQQIRDQFEAIWQQGRDGQLDHWQDTAEGALALIILFDQLPLNMFRGQPDSFATADKALDIAKSAIDNSFDKALTKAQHLFLYMPFMHSEDMADQLKAIALYEAADMPENLRFAHHHKAIVERFGRFPHRNAILGRESTAEELVWLESSEAFKG